MDNSINLWEDFFIACGHAVYGCGGKVAELVLNQLFSIKLPTFFWLFHKYKIKFDILIKQLFFYVAEQDTQQQ